MIANINLTPQAPLNVIQLSSDFGLKGIVPFSLTPAPEGQSKSSNDSSCYGAQRYNPTGHCNNCNHPGRPSMAEYLQS
jgi:hypothetical protein